MSLLVVILLGGSVFLSKVFAQGKEKGPANKTPIGIAVRAEPSPSASAAPVAAVAEPEKKDSDKKDDKDKPIDYAVVGPNGGVPIHTEGPYKSPFAHPRLGGPVTVRVGFLLNHVRNFDIREGTFEAEFYVTFTADKPFPDLDIDSTNGKLDEKEVVASKPTFKMFHMRGVFSTTPDLRRYPFDKQDLEIELEDNQLANDQIKLVPDRNYTNLDGNFHMTGWLVEDFEGRVLNHHYPQRFENEDLYYGRYHFILGIRRFATSAVFSVYVPALVIVLISLMGLWLPREELEVRSNAAAPMLAAAVIFHFTLSQALPATPYLTRADKLMVGVYVCLILNMAATWAWFIFDEKHTDLIFKLGKWVLPVVTLGIMAFVCLV